MKIEGKYQQFKNVRLRRRKWPKNILDQAPIWCSVDLRDGNQALETPMGIEQKKEFFKMLVSLGFKQIEVAFTYICIKVKACFIRVQAHISNTC